VERKCTCVVVFLSKSIFTRLRGLVCGCDEHDENHDVIHSDLIHDLENLTNRYGWPKFRRRLVVFVVGDFLHLQWDVVATLSTLTQSRSVNSCLLSLSLGLSRLKDSDFDPYEEEQKRKNNSPNELHRSSNFCTPTELPTNHESPVTGAMGHYAVPTPNFHAGFIRIS
jgi:hypothetical protein